MYIIFDVLYKIMTSVMLILILLFVAQPPPEAVIRIEVPETTIPVPSSTKQQYLMNLSPMEEGQMISNINPVLNI